MNNECVDIFIIQIEFTANKNRQTLSQPKPWCNDSGVLNLHHGYYTTIMMLRRLFCDNPLSRGTNQPGNQKNRIRTVYEIWIMIIIIINCGIKNGSYDWCIRDKFGTKRQLKKVQCMLCIVPFHCSSLMPNKSVRLDLFSSITCMGTWKVSCCSSCS